MIRNRKSHLQTPDSSSGKDKVGKGDDLDKGIGADMLIEIPSTLLSLISVQRRSE